MRGGYLALGAVLLAGCGGGGDKSTAGDEQAVRAVAQSYLNAVANRNWKAVCATRAPSEVAKFARVGGSCEKVFAALLRKQPVALLKGARPGAVRIKGDVAGIDIDRKGQAGKAITLAAVRENGDWKLKDLPDGQVP